MDYLTQVLHDPQVILAFKAIGITIWWLAIIAFVQIVFSPKW